MSKKDLPQREKPVSKKGRPCLYLDEYCDKVINLSKAGYLMQEIASSLGVDRTTLYNWGRDFPEFEWALCRAAENSFSNITRVGKENLTTENFNQRTYELLFNSAQNACSRRALKTRMKEYDDPSDKCHVVTDSFLDGEINSGDAQSVIDCIVKSSQIDKRLDEKLEKMIDKKLAESAK